MLQPNPTNLIEQIGLTFPIIGFYDAPDISPFKPLVRPKSGKRACVFAFYNQWLTVKGSKRDAEKKLSEILHQIDTGSYTKPGKITVADFLNRWLADYARANLTPSGYERYESITRVHLIPAFGKYN